MLSKTTEYALLALVCVARSEGRPISSQAIARATGVPASYLSKVLQAMCRAGILTSQRGPSGGFLLTQAAADITVFDVAQAVDAWDEPPPDVAPNAATGGVRAFLASLAGQTQRAMQSTTLADLATHE